MRTSSLVLMIALLTTAYDASSQVAFGLKGGLNVTSLNVEDPQLTYDSRSGYHAGVFLRGRFGNVGIQPEWLLFTQNGEVSSSIFGTAQEHFTYLSIPIMLKFYALGGFNLQAGPQFGFLLDGEREYDTFLGSGSEDITDHYKKSDVALSFGAGYDFNFGLGLDVRYNLGLKDINDAANGEPVKSRIFLLSLGWNFLR